MSASIITSLTAEIANARINLKGFARQAGAGLWGDRTTVARITNAPVVDDRDAALAAWLSGDPRHVIEVDGGDYGRRTFIWDDHFNNLLFISLDVEEGLWLALDRVML